jgi:hypothetical protein
MEYRELQIVIIRMFSFCHPFAKQDAQTGDGAVIAAHMDGLSTAGGIILASQITEYHLRFRFQEKSVIFHECFSKFHGKAFIMSPVVSPVRIIAPALQLRIIPSPFSHHIGIYTAVAKPCAVNSSGQAMIFRETIAVLRTGNITFRKEAIYTLVIGRVVIAQLESVVLTVYSLSVIRTMETPGPDT